MNNTRFKQIAIFVLVTIIAIGLPASFAKYMKDDSFNLNVKVEVPFTFTADTVTGENVSGGKITIKKSGWYAIAVKGGDGGSGTVIDDSKLVSSVPGGPGGLIVVKVWLEKDQVLLPYIGSAGGNGGNGRSGAAGTTSAIGSGGKGSITPVDTDVTGVVTQWLSGIMSNSVASGGGGAATSVYVGSKESSNLLCIAGGGGGAAGWSRTYMYPDGSVGVKTVPSGRGGAGGSNILSNASTESKTVSSGFAYVGDNGKIGYYVTSGNDKDYYVYRMVNGTSTIGYGGSFDSAGSGAPLLEVTVLSIYHLKSSGISASGNDGANSKSYGGAGGGGYYGGGSGAGNSISYSAGGGGGGSSFHKSSLNGKSLTKYSSLNNLGLDIASVTYTPYRLDDISHNLTYKTINWKLQENWVYNYSNTPENEKYSMYNVTKNGANVADGFVIVKYLGQS